MKKVLVLCSGNSCRSILAQALINEFLQGVEAKSAGANATKKVNENAKRLLKKKGIWREEYHSKNIEELGDEEFHLVVTVCDRAKESCPMFSKKTKLLHVSFEDIEGMEMEAFRKTYTKMKNELLEKIKSAL